MTLKVENLAFSFPQGGRSLSDISFTLSRGDVTCILGPNGAGKTTLIRCLLGALTPAAGKITVDGAPRQSLSAREFASKVAHVPQSTHSVFGHLVRDIVLMGRSAHLSMMQAPDDHDREIAQDALERVGIADLADRQFATVSGGERQLCLLARSLAQEAPILIMDEPAASLDFGNQIRILGIVASLARNGYAILMTTHHPDHALLVGTQVLCLREGSIFGVGAPRVLLSSAFLSELYSAPIRILEEQDGTRACVPILSKHPVEEVLQNA
ncbi:ABC transporter ATP-binding protein [Mesorhizobium sp. GR13]|uniref:ABC transporter ATP-binding protein n=1 Tax=Mesorhizobium sp. GR13 TaxID=2562308 RepID=UPI0014853F27|nr:ABC transporter ATP-binding protein [Mesorhizobium sp. GR13]